MGEIERIRDQVERAWNGEPWHGISLRQLLLGIGSKEASARPVPGAHSIEEILLHLLTWTSVIRRRMEGVDAEAVTAERDWPKPASTAAGWKKLVAALGAEHAALVKAIGKLDDGDLATRAPGSQVPRYELLQGLLQHDAYHAGQIGMLRRALGK